MSIGQPVKGALQFIVDDQNGICEPGAAGELLIGGSMLFSGYWEKPAETSQAMLDGLLRTGDVAMVDKDGWCFLVDRKKDLIICSGYKVWPREIEDILYAHASVREAAVLGIADGYRGEAVKAVVSLKPGMAASIDDLHQHCRSYLARYKQPALIEIIDELPKTQSGKILRRALRA